MDIILPPHRIQSKPVVVFHEQMQKDAAEMKKLLQSQSFPNGQKGYAISHCQVSNDPYRFFVVLKQLFDEEIIVNPKILEKDERFTNLEACLGYPFRGDKKVSRYNKIRVRYQNTKLETKEVELTGFKACIMQHELAHMQGVTIYDK